MITMKEKILVLRQNIKKFNFSLFLALCIIALAPAIYQTIRTFLISTNGSTEAIDIIGQMEWFDLINETLIAFIIIPLYSILNKVFKEEQAKFAGTVFKMGIIVVIAYAIFQIGVLIYGHHLVSFMNPNEVNLKDVTSYLRLETIAFMMGIIVSYVNVIFVVIGKAKNMYIMLVLNCLLLVISDFILVPNFGVNGVAYSNIIINSLLAIGSVILIILQKYLKIEKYQKADLKIIKDWCKIGSMSGGQSFIDNIVYALMIGKMVNLVAEQGNYWVANNFIWGWLLIPITALTEVIRRDTKDGYQALKQTNYYLIIAGIFIIWLISIPFWPIFFNKVQNLENYQTIFRITIKLLPFYFAYALCIVPDNIFIGLGKTEYNLINSLIINLVYYGIFYLLYLSKMINFTMNTIILMFGFGMVVHLIVSWIEQFIYVKIMMRKKTSY